MSETQISFDTRPLAAEDVGWDKDGLGSKSSYTDHNGTPHTITRINASHVPLRLDTRAELDNVPDVDSALAVLKDRVVALSSSSAVLSADTTITLTSTELTSTLQSLIDMQPKNLGGHTLTFKFSDGLDVVSTDTLEFEGFYNGVLFIDLNEDTVFDASDIGIIFYLHDCFCLAGVKNGSISHTHSEVGIKTERMPCVYMSDLAFTGSGGSTAFLGICSDGVVSNCTYTNDIKDALYGITVQEIRDHNDWGSAHSVLFSAKANNSLDNLTTAGKNSLQTLAFELDWTAVSNIPAADTVYQASRAGVIVVSAQAGTSDGQIGAWALSTNNINGAAIGNQMTVSPSSSGITPLYTVYCFVPKGGYYYVERYNVAANYGGMYFTPFKYSTAG